MELHIVGKTASGEVAVLGVLLEIGDTNQPLSEVFESMPKKVTEEDGAVALKKEIDLTQVVATGAEIVRYTGSLTTPPCTEHVLWDVYLTPATISQKQFEAFSGLYADNARPIQKLNGRELTDLAGDAS